MSRLSITLPSEDAQGRRLRATLRTLVAGRPVPETMCEDLLLVASELFANAVRSADPSSEITVTVNVDTGPVRIDVAVSNVGPGFSPAAVPPPSDDRPGGRGLAIARAVGDLTVEQHDRRTTVLVKLRPPPASDAGTDPGTDQGTDAGTGAEAISGEHVVPAGRGAAQRQGALAGDDPSGYGRATARIGLDGHGDPSDRLRG